MRRIEGAAENAASHEGEDRSPTGILHPSAALDPAIAHSCRSVVAGRSNRHAARNALPSIRGRIRWLLPGHQSRQHRRPPNRSRTDRSRKFARRLHDESSPIAGHLPIRQKSPSPLLLPLPGYPDRRRDQSPNGLRRNLGEQTASTPHQRRAAARGTRAQEQE